MAYLRVPQTEDSGSKFRESDQIVILALLDFSVDAYWFRSYKTSDAYIKQLIEVLYIWIIAFLVFWCILW